MNLKYTYEYNQIKNDITVVYPCFFLVMIFLHFIVFLQFRKIKLEKKEWNFRESFLTKEFMKYDCCHISGTFLLLRLLHYVCECLVGFALILIVWNFPSYFVSSNNNIKIHELHSCNFIRIKHFFGTYQTYWYILYNVHTTYDAMNCNINMFFIVTKLELALLVPLENSVIA